MKQRPNRPHAHTWAAALGLGFLTTSLVPALGDPAHGPSPLPEVGSPGGPSRPLSPVEAQKWLRGQKLFDKPFHVAEGVGTPNMNADSCRGCHQDPAVGGAGGLELNVSRFGRDNGGQGPFMNVAGGQGLSKLRPPTFAGREEYDSDVADVFEQRQTPTLFGVGLIDSISDEEVMSHADPDDSNGDGIFGYARMIDTGGATLEVGKFGWKAQIPTVEDFIHDAMGAELGMTTHDDGRGFAFLSDGDSIADPELPTPAFGDMLFFLSNLAAPQRVGSEDPQVLVGESLFDMIGCAICHVPALEGADGPVPLYSDLLLHNVMAAGYRGMAEPDAGPGYFRTAPLWGIRDTAPYMHDGRAETILDAIMAHDGEAADVRTEFLLLSPADKDALLAFLQDI